MASPKGELSYGSVEIFHSEILGTGAYGKVCKAKCGQLPCAAKLLHDSLFWGNDPLGTQNLTSRFLQECQFLSNIKHPNIVQYLGTATDVKAKGPVLLMELMDEDLTKYLTRLTEPLPYHSQLNICHDVALALAYLHSNAIIHRDLSSNNVLLIGEGNRAKVTDFGMSKLTEMNPRMTQLTQVPGTPAYMPPEALTTPPHYSNQLDCFSHGVLTLQMITRNFPDPGNSTTTVKDRKSPTGIAFIPISEIVRRKKDLDLVENSHPLLPTVIHCLEDRDTKRPSANELCERLASLKREPRYTKSIEQQKLAYARTTEEFRKAIAKKDKVIQRILQEHHERVQEEKQATRRLQLKLHTMEAEMKKLGRKNKAENIDILKTSVPLLSAESNIKWKHGEPFPEKLTSLHEAAVVAENTIYVTCGHHVYSFMLTTNKWSRLAQHKCSNFGLMVLIGTLTSIGGYLDGKPTNTLYSLVGKSWDEVFPPMATERVHPAVVNITTHLVVAGGRQDCQESALATVEILNINNFQWYSAGSLPVCHPEMTICNGYFYCSEGNSIYSCVDEDLLQSRSDAWKRLASIPVPNNSSLAVMSGHVMVVGGTDDPLGDNPTGVIHCYDASTDSWNVIGEMPTPRSSVLTAVLPTNELVVVGGHLQLGHSCSIVNIGSK